MLAGKHFGQYDIVSQIGQGGMGAVYLARQPAVARNVAIKFLPEELARDEMVKARFRQEATIIAQLAHPHILPLFDYGEEGGVPYLVMPLIEGGSFEDQIRRGPISLVVLVQVVEQTASALDYAHGRKVVHRDLKPGNILCDADGHAYLSDFGIAKILNANTSLTTGGIIGTPAYMAPEQFRGQAAQPQMDVYALGVILYRCLLGEFPFTGDMYEVLNKKLTDAPRRPRDINPAFPEPLERVLLSALDRDMSVRYRSAGALAASFKQALGTAQPPTVVDTPPAQPARRTQLLGFTGAAALIALTCFLAAGVLAAIVFVRPPVTQPTSTPFVPVPMTGELNIAVAVLVVDDSPGQTGDAAGGAVAQQIAQRVGAGIQAALQGSDVIYQVNGPDKVGLVRGATGDERAASAAALAAKIRADILVYGVVTDSAGSLTIEPSFYLSERAFATVPDLLGQHALGGPITVSGSGDLATRIENNKLMADRAQALALMAAGLEKLALADNQAALSLFGQAAAIQNWPDALGKETVYLMLANAAGRMDKLDQAEADYKHALQINPDYARAHIGLGSIYYRRAFGVPPVKSAAEISQPDLDQAQAEYAIAQAATNQPATADIGLRVAFATGQLALTRYQITSDPQLAKQANDQFTAVVQAADAGNVRIGELAALAHGYLGTLALLAHDGTRAETELVKAVDMVVEKRPRASFWSQLGTLYEGRGDLPRAISAFEQAVATAPDDDSRALYQSQLDQLRATAQPQG